MLSNSFGFGGHNGCLVLAPVAARSGRRPFVGPWTDSTTRAAVPSLPAYPASLSGQRRQQVFRRSLGRHFVPDLFQLPVLAYEEGRRSIPM